MAAAAPMRLVAKLGYDPVFGARPLKRVIQRELADPVASLILSGEVGDGSTVAVSSDGSDLRVSVLTP